MTDTVVNQLVTSLGRYDVVRMLGEGGMAQVFLARHVGPGGFSKDVVIKRMRPELVRRERARKMFLREGARRCAAQPRERRAGIRAL